MRCGPLCRVVSGPCFARAFLFSSGVGGGVLCASGCRSVLPVAGVGIVGDISAVWGDEDRMDRKFENDMSAVTDFIQFAFPWGWQGMGKERFSGMPCTWRDMPGQPVKWVMQSGRQQRESGEEIRAVAR